MILIAIDPGLVIGWAEFKCVAPAEGAIYNAAHFIQSGQCGKLWEIPHIDLISVFETIVVVYERYYVSKPAQGLEASEQIGVLHYLKGARSCCIDILVCQEPSILHFMDSKYNLQGIRGVPGIHAKSAFKHGLYYIAQNLKINVKELIEDAQNPRYRHANI